MLDLTKRETVGNNWRQPLSKISFDAAGLIALADLSTLAKRTALTGTSVYLDALLLCPGIHKQQTASELNKSELPPTAALTSGYVFRTENQATVAYLQSVGITGSLVTLLVETEVREGIAKFWTFLFGPDDSVLGVFLLLVTRILTISGIVFMIVIEDWWGLVLMLALVTARLSTYSLYVDVSEERAGTELLSRAL